MIAKIKQDTRSHPTRITLHPASERGVAEEDWLSSRFSFSFADYYDPTKMGFGALRVLNDDIIAPSAGFPTHPHRDKEIVTVLLRGALAHKDSTGGEGVLQAGDVQAMSAGSGIRHSEYNASKTDEVALLQLWIRTRERGVAPTYAQRQFDLAKDAITPLVTPDSRDGTLRIAQDATIGRALLAKGKELAIDAFDPEDDSRGIYLFVIDGNVTVEGHAIGRRDAIGVAGTGHVTVRATSDADVLLIDVPM